MSRRGSIPVVVILGPTAAGKSDVAIRLAERLGGEIVSADSRLLYRGMDIGTAKPTAAQRKRVRHHLIDVTDPEVPWSMATYRSATKEVLRQIDARGRLPMLVGGTGQYLTALLEGWKPSRSAPDDALRCELEAIAEKHGPQALHDRLRGVDPQAAARIDFRNVRRVVRALEIYHITGLPPSEASGREPSGLLDLRIGLHLPRQELYARIDARIDAMLGAGLVDEVRGLLARGISPDVPAMSAIGYRQIIRFLQGEISQEQAVRDIRRASRQFVRRQANWFRADDERIHWFYSHPAVDEDILPLIQSWLDRIQRAD